MFPVSFSSISHLNLFHSAMIYSCFIVIAAGIFLEGLKLIRHLVDNKFPHKNGARFDYPFGIHLNKSIAVTSKSCSPFRICCTLYSSEYRLSGDSSRMKNNNFQMVWGYLCMLMFMSFSLYICVSLIIGIVIGFFLFGARIPSNWGSDKWESPSHLTSSCLFISRFLQELKCTAKLFLINFIRWCCSFFFQIFYRSSNSPLYWQMFRCKRNIEENSV